MKGDVSASSSCQTFSICLRWEPCSRLTCHHAVSGVLHRGRHSFEACLPPLLPSPARTEPSLPMGGPTHVPEPAAHKAANNPTPRPLALDVQPQPDTACPAHPASALNRLPQTASQSHTPLAPHSHPQPYTACPHRTATALQRLPCTGSQEHTTACSRQPSSRTEHHLTAASSNCVLHNRKGT